MTPSTSFTESSEALASILTRYRDETLPLEEAIALFEEGVGHIKHCQQTLSQSKGKVEQLIEGLEAPVPMNQETQAHERGATKASEATSSSFNRLQFQALAESIVSPQHLESVFKAIKKDLGFNVQSLPKATLAGDGQSLYLTAVTEWGLISIMVNLSSSLLELWVQCPGAPDFSPQQLEGSLKQALPDLHWQRLA